MKKYKLRSQFIISFLCILTFSLFFTIITYLSAISIYKHIQYRIISPGSYFEEKLPNIQNYISKRGQELLNIKEKGILNKVIFGKEVSYEVLDENGHIIYGTNNNDIIQNKVQFYNTINTTLNVKGSNQKHERLIPIIDNNSRILGGVLISYKLTAAYKNNYGKIWGIFLVIIILISPFIYISLFTFIFSKILANNISKPLKLLMNASKNIKEKNLDFNINYESSNEIGQLCTAFNDMKQELQKSLSLQWRMEQEKLDIIESLVHDMKNPLSIINGYIDLIEEGNIKDKQKLQQYLDIIKKNIYKSFEFIKKIQYNEVNGNLSTNIRLTYIDIITFIKNKVENYKLIAAQNGIDIILHIDDERQSEKAMFVNIENLERIFDNIISNSFRYTPQKGNIGISVQIYSEKIYFSICNSGKSFDTNDIPNIFKKLYRGVESKSTKDGHVGLGLYIAKQLVEKNGGTITALNPEQGGACINFEIKCNWN
ncbi:MAG: HAMP domain-containing sensor histidine kinase [Clostridium sp.]|nr:HAMP domain-containing sensor histidine kinase [Clostridium sp.]